MLHKPTALPLEFYPLVDFYHGPRLTNEERRDLRAVATGEFRAPRRGEWFLSGAIIEAYEAKNDLTTPYHIARIVITTTTVTEKITRTLPNTPD